MKRIVAIVAVLGLSSGAFADQYVNGYYRRDGTYVQPHLQTEPNQYRFDNYSSKGNVNPYTGQAGHQRNEYTSPPAYNQNYGNQNYNNTNRQFDPYRIR